MTATRTPPLVRSRGPASPANGRRMAGSPAARRPHPRQDSTNAVAALPGSYWRELLETRWQARLVRLTELSLAFHDTAERTSQASDRAAELELRRLQLRTVAARRALADTEEALGRLSAGRYGHCEQCDAGIPSPRLVGTPEARYCQRCSPGTHENP